ncbi:hypothetical protein, partial [Streptomyces albus]|uniref:hypothetical protein n=1 Tax=Streptomyces albus TaxID=1888 RepID=UPI001B809A0D
PHTLFPSLEPRRPDAAGLGPSGAARMRPQRTGTLTKAAVRHPHGRRTALVRLPAARRTAPRPAGRTGRPGLRGTPAAPDPR